MLLSRNGVTGTANPQILSYAPTFRQLIYDRRGSHLQRNAVRHLKPDVVQLYPLHLLRSVD